MRHHRAGLLLVDREALGDDLGRVVRPALGAGPSREPREKLLAWSLEQDDRPDVASELGEEPVERVRLRHGPREAVEHDARVSRDLAKPLADHIHGDLVGHVLASIEERLGQPAELGPAPRVVPEDVTGGEVHPAVLLDERLRLRALADPGRADEDEVAAREIHRGLLIAGMKPPYRLMLSATSLGTNVNAV